MRLSALAFTAILSLVSAKNINMRCEFAADKTGMVQQPFCCRDLTVARGNSKVNEAMDCMNHVYGCLTTEHLANHLLFQVISSNSPSFARISLDQPVAILS